jgi:hypothetical protein
VNYLALDPQTEEKSVVRKALLRITSGEIEARCRRRLSWARAQFGHSPESGVSV